MLVSIIIPVYNGEKTIERAIKSVINQKCKDYELIIVDGNSSDNTLNIVSKYKNYINYIISEPDKGYADAFNKGIKVAVGDFIMMLAADDLLLPLAIEKFKNSVNQDTEVWCGSIILKMHYGYRLRKSNPDLGKLRLECSLENPASFYKRSLFNRYGYLDTSFKCAADREMFLRLYTNNAKYQIEQIPIVLFEMGGISTADPEKYGIIEDQRVSIKYGLSEKDAKAVTKSHRKVFLKEKRLASLKKNLAFIRFLPVIYNIVGKRDGCLTKSRLISLGVPLDKAK